MRASTVPEDRLTWHAFAAMVSSEARTFAPKAAPYGGCLALGSGVWGLGFGV